MKKSVRTCMLVSGLLLSVLLISGCTEEPGDEAMIQAQIELQSIRAEASSQVHSCWKKVADEWLLSCLQ